MDTLSGLMQGLIIAVEPSNLFYCLIGALVGTLIGVLPGIGPVATMAMLLPVTFYVSPVAALIMLAGIYYGAQYGGSTTAILVNLPGESSAVVTCLDGYQMARQGRAGPALAIAALASLFAGIFATLFIALFAPVLAQVALAFTAAEYFSLMVLGLLASVVMAQGNILKALGMIVLGLLLAVVGTDINTGMPRLTFGITELAGGIDFVPLSMGLFAVAEIITRLASPADTEAKIAKVGNLWLNKDDFRRGGPAAFRGTMIGSVLGLIPGGGAMLSSFASYAVEKKVSRNSSSFGKGAVEGLAAPEAANNAGAQTSFIPLLTLGIPANAVIALMAGAMMMQGVQPGPQLMIEHPNIFWGVIASMLIGNLMLVIINLPLIRIWVKLISIPYRVLYPLILVCCCIGTYAIERNIVSIYLLIVFGLLGVWLIKLRCEPAPLLLAFVLGPMMEENFRRAMLLSRGDAMVFIERPISAALLFMAVAIVGVIIFPSVRRFRGEAFREE